MNIEQARFNMIEQQIRPWEVLDQSVLDTIAKIRREDFVPPACRALAFVDMSIPLTVDGVATGQHMFSPKQEARLLQELKPRSSDHVLEIGAGSGYMAALLASRTHSVQSWETHPALAAFAAANLTRAGLNNAKVVEGDGFTAQGAFDIIAVSGAVEALPPALLDLLKPGGRLVAIVGAEPVMSAVLVTRLGESFDEVKLFETLVQPLTGGPRLQRFKF
jgi:protein-L-isoaspartate(D-aspartate) O-methyltransferase